MTFVGYSTDPVIRQSFWLSGWLAALAILAAIAALGQGWRSYGHDLAIFVALISGILAVFAQIAALLWWGTAQLPRGYRRIAALLFPVLFVGSMLYFVIDSYGWNWSYASPLNRLQRIVTTLFVGCASVTIAGPVYVAAVKALEWVRDGFRED